MTSRSLFAGLVLSLVPFASPAAAQGPPVDPDVGRGSQLISQGKFDEAVTVLEAVLDRDPSESWAWFNLGLAHHSAGRLNEALRGHMLSLVGAPPQSQLRSTASYNVACVHALQGRPEFAMQWLHRSRLAGLNQSAGMLADGDFESLKEDPRFTSLSANLAIGPLAGATVSSLGAVHPGYTGGVTCAPDGTLYVADFGPNVYRVVPGEKPELLATGFTQSAGCALEPDGSLIQADFKACKVWRIAPDGTKQDLGLQGLRGPVGVTRAEDGTLFMVDFLRRAVLKVAPGEQPEELVAGGQLKGPNGICLAPDGDLYVCNYQDGAVLRVTQEGALSFVAELPGGGNGHLLWHDGALFVTARSGNAVFRVTPGGVVTRVAGNGSQGLLDGPGSTAQLALPNGIAISPDGRALYTNDVAPGGSFQLRAIRIPDAAQ